MLGKKIDEHGSKVFLVNTGWTGGIYGVGSRMNLGYTRSMVRAAIAGKLDNVETKKNEIFGLNMPLEIEGVPSNVLHPRYAWEDPNEYDKEANRLADAFRENFKKFSHVSEDIAIKGGPPVIK